MSNRMFQGVIYQMKDAIGRVVGVTDEMGVVIACSELGQIDSIKDGVQAERMDIHLKASPITNAMIFMCLWRALMNMLKNLQLCSASPCRASNSSTMKSLTVSTL